MPQLNDGDLLLYIAVGPQRAAQLWAKRATGENIADPAVAAFGGPSVAALPDSQQSSDTWLDRNWPWAAAGLGGVGLLGGAGYAYWKNERDKKKRQAELLAAQGLAPSVFGLDKEAADERLGPLRAMTASRAVGNEYPYLAGHLAGREYSDARMPIRGAWARYVGGVHGGEQLRGGSQYVSPTMRYLPYVAGAAGGVLDLNADLPSDVHTVFGHQMARAADTAATFGDPRNVAEARKGYNQHIRPYHDEPDQVPASEAEVRRAAGVTPRTLMNAADVVARDHDIAAHAHNRDKRPLHYWLNPLVPSGPINEIIDRLRRRGSAEKADPDATLRASLYVPGIPTARGLLGGHNAEKREKARALAGGARSLALDEDQDQGLKLAFAKNSDWLEDAKRWGNENVVDPIAQRAGGVAGNEFKSKVEGINPFSGVSLKDNNWLTGAMWGAPIGAGIGLVGGLFNRKKKRNAFGDALTGGLLGAGAGALGGAAWDLFKDPASPPPPPPPPAVQDTPGEVPSTQTQSVGRVDDPFGKKPQTTLEKVEQGVERAPGNLANNIPRAAALKEQGIQNLNDSVRPSVQNNLGLTNVFRRAGNPAVAAGLTTQRNDLDAAGYDPTNLAPQTRGMADQNLALAASASRFANRRAPTTAAFGGPVGATTPERDPTYDYEAISPFGADPDANAQMALGGVPLYAAKRVEDAGRAADEIAPLLPEIRKAWLASRNPALDEDQRSQLGGLDSALGYQALLGGAGGATIRGLGSALRQAGRNAAGPRVPDGVPKDYRTGDPARRTAYNLLEPNTSPYRGPASGKGNAEFKTETTSPSGEKQTFKQTGPDAVQAAQQAKANGGRGFWGRLLSAAGAPSPHNLWPQSPIAPEFAPGASPVATPAEAVQQKAVVERVRYALKDQHGIMPTGQNAMDVIEGRPTVLTDGKRTVNVPPTDRRAILDTVARGRSSVAPPGRTPLPTESPAFVPRRGALRAGISGAPRGIIPGAVGLPVALNLLDRQLTTPQVLGGPKPFNPAELVKTPQDYDKLVADAARVNNVSPDEAKQILEAGGIQRPASPDGLVGAEVKLYDALDSDPRTAFRQLEQLTKQTDPTTGQPALDSGVAWRILKSRHPQYAAQLTPDVFGAKPSR